MTSAWSRVRCAATSTSSLGNRSGATEFGTRTETKNVNSLRSVERAVRSEMIRQAGLLDQGDPHLPGDAPLQRDARATPVPDRSKEEATDYRYFPEPDLVPIAPDGRRGSNHSRAGSARAARRPPGPRATDELDLSSGGPAVQMSERRRHRSRHRRDGGRRRAGRRRPATGGWATWPRRRTSREIEPGELGVISPAAGGPDRRAGGLDGSLSAGAGPSGRRRGAGDRGTTSTPWWPSAA